MIMKSTMCVNWMPAKVISSQRSWAGGKVVCMNAPMKTIDSNSLGPDLLQCHNSRLFISEPTMETYPSR
jgi:hypothetical protein